MFCVFFFFFKQKTAYEMRISDWSSDVCSSDLAVAASAVAAGGALGAGVAGTADWANALPQQPSNNSSGAKRVMPRPRRCPASASCWRAVRRRQGWQNRTASDLRAATVRHWSATQTPVRSEEHTSELQYLMHTSQAGFV